MAISIDWKAKVIFVPTADLTQIQVNPFPIYNFNLNDFRTELGDLLDDEEGMPFDTTHVHTAPLNIGGVILARVVEIINSYTITFEDGQHAVNILGGNSNVGDNVNVNQVSIRSANSAGLIVAETGVSGLTQPESDALLQNTTDLSTMTASMTVVEGDIGLISTDISSMQTSMSIIEGDITSIQVDISGIKDDIITINTSLGSIVLDISSIQTDLAFMKAIEEGEWKIENNQMIFYNSVDAEIARFNLYGKTGNPTDEDVYRRVPV